MRGYRLIVLFVMLLMVTGAIRADDGLVALPRDGSPSFHAEMCDDRGTLYAYLFAPDGFESAKVKVGSSFDSLSNAGKFTLVDNVYEGEIPLHDHPMPTVGKVTFKNSLTKEKQRVLVNEVPKCVVPNPLVVKKFRIKNLPLTPGTNQTVVIAIKNDGNETVKNVTLQFGTWNWPDNTSLPQSPRDGDASKAYNVVDANGTVSPNSDGIYVTVKLEDTVLKPGEKLKFKLTIQPVDTVVQPGRNIHLEADAMWGETLSASYLRVETVAGEVASPTPTNTLTDVAATATPTVTSTTVSTATPTWTTVPATYTPTNTATYTPSMTPSATATQLHTYWMQFDVFVTHFAMEAHIVTTWQIDMMVSVYDLGTYPDATPQTHVCEYNIRPAGQIFQGWKIIPGMHQDPNLSSRWTGTFTLPDLGDFAEIKFRCQYLENGIKKISRWQHWVSQNAQLFHTFQGGDFEAAIFVDVVMPSELAYDQVPELNAITCDLPEQGLVDIGAGDGSATDNGNITRRMMVQGMGSDPAAFPDTYTVRCYTQDDVVTFPAEWTRAVTAFK